jgi:hypothetical protein
MKTIKCQRWAEFRELIDSEKGTNPVYWRGQSDISTPLASSFERTVLIEQGGHENGAEMIYPYGGRYQKDTASVYPPGAVRERRDRYLEAFQKAASGLRGANPAPLTTEQWWALGRHQGLISPFLDWSEKPYIAAFFMLVELFQKMNTPHGPELSGEHGALYRLEHAPALEGDGLKVVRVMLDELGRLNSQRGVFTWIDSEDYFELQGFLEHTGRGHLLTRVILTDECVVPGLRDLYAHGIDYRMIFPDLTGAAMMANMQGEM